MTKSYQEHFNLRGSAYDRAMQRCPDARAEEFTQALKAVNPSPPMVVADVPSGGGYLRRYLPKGCTWTGHEPCASFTRHGALADPGVPLLPLPWADHSIDTAFTLAGVHHIDDKRPLFAELFRVVKPGGKLVVSDVAEGSIVAKFLDGYVGTHNSTGHEGVFLNEHTLHELREVGWRLESCRTVDFHWLFADRNAMASFCHELFDLRSSTVADTAAVIEAQLGVTDWSDHRIGMRWSLMTIGERLAVPS